MTKAKNKEEWITAWRREANYLYGCYQCRADKEVYAGLNNAIKAVFESIEEIAELMEKEGTWTNAEPI